MIIVGAGALQREAINLAISRGRKIDFVVSATTENSRVCKDHSIPYIVTDDVNNEWLLFEEHLGDGVVLSVNNGQIFHSRLLNLPTLRFYNVHGGPLPLYRGRSEICIIFAILNEEPSYGCTLHLVDQGIDTGKTIDMSLFRIEPADTFQTLMLKTIEHCRDILIRNFDTLMDGSIEFKSVTGTKSRIYNYESLAMLTELRQHPAFKRATKFGIYQLWFPKLVEIVRELTSKPA